MRRNRNTLIVLVLVILALVAGGYLYTDHRNETERLARLAEQVLAEGIGLYEQDRYAEAVNLLESLPGDAPPDWRLPYYTGMAQIQLKDFEAASRNLEAAVQLDNSQIGPLFALGVTYFKLGKLRLSKSYFAAVLEIDPGNHEARGMMNTMAGLERMQAGDSPDG